MRVPRITESFRDSGRRERLIVWGVAAAALVPFASLAMPDDRVLPYYEWSDYAAYHLPVHEFIREEFLACRVPLWIPWLGNGTPLHASQQAGVFYPGVSLLLLLFPANYALRLALVLHLGLAFLGQYRLCRALGTSALAASLGALAVVQGGFMVNHLVAGHVNVVIGGALVPWFLWALVRLLDAPGACRAALAAVVGSAFALGSHPQVSYYALLAGTAWVAGSLAFARAGAAHRLRAVGWVTLSGLLAAAIGSVQTLPSLELVGDGRSGSPRGDVAFAADYALDGLDLARLLAPNVAGNPFLRLPALGRNDFFHERVCYMGLVTLALAAYGLTRAKAALWQWGAAAAVLVGLAIALGRTTPWFSWIGGFTPGLFWFRCPGRAFAVIAPLVALLAARGCDAIVHAEARARGTALWRTAVALAWVAWVVVSALMHERTHSSWLAARDDRSSGTDAALAAAAVFGALTVSAMVLVRLDGGRSIRLGAIILLALAVADLGYHNASNFWLQEPQPTSIPADVLAIEPPMRFIEAPQYPQVSAEMLRYSRLGLTAVRNRRSMVGTDDGGILPGALTRYWHAVEGNPGAALAVGGCGYVTHSGAPWRPLHGALPRARFATGRAAALCGAGIEDLSDDDLLTLANDLPKHAPRSSHSRGTERGADGDPRVGIVIDEPRRLELRVAAPADGVLVVADTCFAGWACEVDAQPAAIWPAHGVFRAVNLTAGDHAVAFEYQPRSFYRGLAGSIAGLACTGVLAIYGLLARLGRQRSLAT